MLEDPEGRFIILHEPEFNIEMERALKQWNRHRHDDLAEMAQRVCRGHHFRLRGTVRDGSLSF